MQKAPEFSLNDQHGNTVQLSNYSGKWLVLYFYPKDDTPGCTTEACNFRDGRQVLQQMGAEVVGISKDTPRSHAKFAQKFNLDFTLLSDPDHSVTEAYGSWKPKKLMGREFLGIVRDTYLINPKGYIFKKYDEVDPKMHIGDIIKDLQAVAQQ